MDTEAIARVCHEANRAYCASIGDDSQPPWNEASGWQRESAFNGVVFARANPDAPDSAQHDSWLDAKAKDGWVYGPEKRDDTRTHPCILPFSELPVEQRRKDTLFRAVVLALSAGE